MLLRFYRLETSAIINVIKIFSDRFTPDILMSRIQEQGLELGMIIDLTFTRKYYNSQVKK